MNILITGGKGLIGTELSKLLSNRGHSVSVLTRNPKSNARFKEYYWDPVNSIIVEDALIKSDVIINLAGENIGEKKLNSDRKIEILKSRTQAIELIYKKCSEIDKLPKHFISSSATGFYGAKTSENIFTETDSSGDDFLAQVCVAWERAADVFESAGTRVVKVRTGVVLSKTGGALEKMIRPVKFGFGSALGSGKQIVPWIHIDDLCGIYAHIIENEQLIGIFNAVAPVYSDNETLMKTIAKVLEKPFIMPNVPGFVLRIVLGEMSKAILEGSKISARKIIDSGYRFHYSDLLKALDDLLKNNV